MRVCKEQHKQYMREYMRKYRKTAKGKAHMDKYNSSETKRKWYWDNKEYCNKISRLWNKLNYVKAVPIEKNCEHCGNTFFGRPHKKFCRLVCAGLKRYRTIVARSDETAKMFIPSRHCIKCGAWWKVQTDHIIPLSRGGMHTLKNLCTMCFTCNRAKSTKFIEEWLPPAEAKELRKKIANAHSYMRRKYAREQQAEDTANTKGLRFNVGYRQALQQRVKAHS